MVLIIPYKRDTIPLFSASIHHSSIPSFHKFFQFLFIAAISFDILSWI